MDILIQTRSFIVLFLVVLQLYIYTYDLQQPAATHIHIATLLALQVFQQFLERFGMKSVLPSSNITLKTRCM